MLKKVFYSFVVKNISSLDLDWKRMITDAASYIPVEDSLPLTFSYHKKILYCLLQTSISISQRSSCNFTVNFEEVLPVDSSVRPSAEKLATRAMDD